jgi:hypothetical protein
MKLLSPALVHKRLPAFSLLLALTAGSLGQPSNVPRIGWVLSGTPENSGHLIEAMRQGLADEGLVVGRSVELDVRFTAGRSERYAEHFGELIRNPVSVLAASGFAGIAAARDASAGRIPIVAYFCGNDVKQMVESFARPGGNITGVSCLSAELAAKRIELLKDALPALRRIGFLYDPRLPGKEKELAEIREIVRGRARPRDCRLRVRRRTASLPRRSAGSRSTALVRTDRRSAPERAARSPPAGRPRAPGHG